MPAEIRVPEFGESIVEATVSHWIKQQGEFVNAGEAVVELETEKANVEVGAPQAGVLSRIDRKAGEDVRVGDVLGLLEDAPKQEAAPPPSAPPEKETREEEKPGVAEPVEPPGRETKKRATHLAVRVAQDQGVDLTHVTGTGPGSQITQEDVQSYAEGQKQEVSPAAPIPSTAGPQPAPGQVRPEERQHMSRRRLTIARRMLEATQTSAMLTSFNEVDMTAVVEIRKRQKEAFQAQHNVHLGIVSFFVKAAIGALRDFPILNAEIQADEIVLKRYYDIGVAIGAAEGLVVPVLRDADRMSFAEIEKSIKTFAQKAEQKTFSLEDLRGGTFTITNGGVFGSLLSTPILNPPQVGILGLHKIEDRPMVHKGEVAVRPMMYIALTYDHRIVDGREAVQFLVRIKDLIENPEQLLLEI